MAIPQQLAIIIQRFPRQVDTVRVLGAAIMSNYGKWTEYYRGVNSPQPYGDTHTYQIGASYLTGLDTIEDWGCGLGWLRRYLPPANYRGIDGSESPFADAVVDLEEYVSDVDGIFMRHVLEHNFGWQRILRNAVKSFRKRMVLILFTPFSEESKVIGQITLAGSGLQIPDISFSKNCLIAEFGPAQWTLQEGMHTNTQYQVEHIFFLSKEPPEDVSLPQRMPS